MAFISKMGFMITIIVLAVFAILWLVELLPSAEVVEAAPKAIAVIAVLVLCFGGLHLLSRPKAGSQKSDNLPK